MTERITLVFSDGLGDRVTLTEFGADGYNAEGGGPVNSGSALTCKFDGRPCCWANVPPPDDQLDWHVGSGPINTTIWRNAPSPRKSSSRELFLRSLRLHYILDQCRRAILEVLHG
ncbi:hypothetical protein OESDEN_03124 [Oesophagostomum dentatum]|uniref:Uncharacterized protein n=1 Tax=Oesophagostomum dentatum TaxID=61180 RepID=A0A0B1TH65_OESDE|nr:hypothetical protein OESDEN_03124 [Oesophagostomum dentatum]